MENDDFYNAIAKTATRIQVVAAMDGGYERALERYTHLPAEARMRLRLMATELQRAQMWEFLVMLFDEMPGIIKISEVSK